MGVRTQDPTPVTLDESILVMLISKPGYSLNNTAKQITQTY